MQPENIKYSSVHAKVYVIKCTSTSSGAVVGEDALGERRVVDGGSVEHELVELALHAFVHAQLVRPVLERALELAHAHLRLHLHRAVLLEHRLLMKIIIEIY